MLSPFSFRIAARSPHKRTISDRALIFDPRFILQIRTFWSGADGIRTHALRHAKSDLMVHRGPPTFANPHR
jgi:hypothetical protein